MKTRLLALMLTLVNLPNTMANTPEENRIISAGSSITELIFALGAQDQLVAVDVTSKSFNKDNELPQVGYHRQLSAEGLMSLNPTHIVGSHEMGPDATLQLLDSAGIEVETVPSGDSKVDLFERIDAIALLTGTQEEASILKTELKDILDRMSQRHIEQPPKVMFAMLSKGRPATIAGRNTTIDKIISLAGGTNPAYEHLQSYKPVSAEAIVDMQPDYLLVTHRAWDALGGFDGIISAFPLLAATPAAANQNIKPIHGSAIIGGLGLASLDLADELYNDFSQPHPQTQPQ